MYKRLSLLTIELEIGGVAISESREKQYEKFFTYT